SVPYHYTNLDGQQIADALGTLLVQAAADVFPKIRTALPNQDSYVLAGILVVNIVSYAAACTVFYAAMLPATHGIALSAILAVALLLSPQMIAINILRPDFQIFLPLMVMFYCGIVLVQGEERPRHAFLLGVSFAFLATIKISGLAYAIFPLL